MQNILHWPLVFLWIICTCQSLLNKKSNKMTIHYAKEINSPKHNNVNITSQSCMTARQHPRKNVKWGIICLLNPSKPMEIRDRNKLLRFQLQHFYQEHNFVFIFFSEAEIDEEIKVQILLELCQLGDVQFIDSSKDRYYLPNMTYGYSYMCKFYAIDMYPYLQALGIDYYLRIDSDCILREMRRDIFTFVERRQLDYAYIARKLEAHNLTLETLPKYVLKYVQMYQISPRFPMNESLSMAINFYNNFHVGKVAFFMSPLVRKFLLYLNETGGIFQYRWGDSTLQAYAVRLFVEPNHIDIIPGVAYFHGSHDLFLSSLPKHINSNIVPNALSRWNHSSHSIILEKTVI
jgi:hypothetical protein